MSTPSQIFAEIDTLLAADPSRYEGTSATYQFDLTGEGGGTYHITIAGGQAEAGAGPIPNPDTLVAMAASDFVDFRGGKLDATMAFMSGKLKISGDTGKAMKLVSILQR